MGEGAMEESLTPERTEQSQSGFYTLVILATGSMLKVYTAGRLSYCERWLGREGPLGKPDVTQLSAASAALTVVWLSTTLTFPSVGFVFLRISILSYSWTGEGGPPPL